MHTWKVTWVKENYRPETVKFRTPLNAQGLSTAGKERQEERVSPQKKEKVKSMGKKKGG